MQEVRGERRRTCDGRNLVARSELAALVQRIEVCKSLGQSSNILLLGVPGAIHHIIVALAHISNTLVHVVDTRLVLVGLTGKVEEAAKVAHDAAALFEPRQ